MLIKKGACYLTFFLVIMFFTAMDISLHVKVDFSSFYSSIHSWLMDVSPYKVQPLNFLNSNKTASVNLNTPFFVVLLSPLSLLPYEKAYLVWQVGAFLALVCSIKIILQKYQLYQTRYLWAFFFSYPILMNFFIGQIAPYVLLFITLGERAQKRKQPVLAGMLWGFITGIKLFTGILFFYLLFKRDRRGILSFSSTFILTLVLPFLIAGPYIYYEYFGALKSINWYIHAWNGSLYAFIERTQILWLFSSDKITQQLLSSLILFSVLCSYFYLLIYKEKEIQDKAFNLTLIYMLMINPLSWHYYFLLLLAPWASLLSKESKFCQEKKLLGILLFILFAYPRHSNVVTHSSDLLVRLTTGSQYFYCLLLTLAMTYFEGTQPNSAQKMSGYYEFLKIIVIFIIYMLILDFSVSNIIKLFNNSGEWLS